MSEARVAIQGGSLAWDAIGSGDPIVLVHGFTFDRRMWDPQMEALSAQNRVIRYDLRGFGGSSKPNGSYSHAEDLAVLLDALQIERPVLLGLSLGANTVLEFAANHPGRTRALVLASAGLPGFVWSTPRPPDEIAQMARTDGVAAAKRSWLAHPIFTSSQGTPAEALLREMVEAYDGWHWTNPDPRRLPGDLTQSLARIDVPALIVSGETDAPGYREIARLLSRELAGAHFAEIEGAGHALNLDRPDAFNWLVLNFTRSLTGENDPEESSRTGL